MRILSIDFDWVMEPCIEAYNKISRQNELGPYKVWETIEKVMPGVSFEMDFQKYNTLYFFLRDTLSINGTKSLIIEPHHEAIIDVIMSTAAEGETLEIINIDHHHDLGYFEHERNNPELRGDGNWVSYIMARGYNVQSYTWINNKNSRDINFYPDIKNLNVSSDLGLLTYSSKPFDLVFICSSWEWVPLKYVPLFSVFVNEPWRIGLQ